MIVLGDRVAETSTAPGTGTFTLDGAIAGFQDFLNGIGNGNECWYAATNGTDWEVGRGTFTSGATDTLTRAVLLDSSTGSPINFTGTVNVINTAPASIFDGSLQSEIAARKLETWGANDLVLRAATGGSPFQISTLAETLLANTTAPQMRATVSAAGSRYGTTITAANDVAIPAGYDSYYIDGAATGNINGFSANNHDDGAVIHVHTTGGNATYKNGVTPSAGYLKLIMGGTSTAGDLKPLANEHLTFVKTPTEWRLIGYEVASRRIGLLDIQVFESSGTWTKPAGTHIVEVICVGGGGGSGGINASTRPSTGPCYYGTAGGGAGAFRWDWADDITGIGATEAVTVGAGGAAGGIGTDGGNGGTSSFGSHVSCQGGRGSSGVTSIASASIIMSGGPIGGSTIVTKGSIGLSLGGNDGFEAVACNLSSATVNYGGCVQGGMGGASPITGGSQGTTGKPTGAFNIYNGVNAQDWGSGAAGAGYFEDHGYDASPTSATGGAGADGLVIVKSYG